AALGAPLEVGDRVRSSGADATVVAGRPGYPGRRCLACAAPGLAAAAAVALLRAVPEARWRQAAARTNGRPPYDRGVGSARPRARSSSDGTAHGGPAGYNR